MKQLTAEQVFFDALDWTDPAQRDRFIQEACGGDAQLQSEVEALLRANEHAEEKFPTEPGGQTNAPTPIAEIPGSTIGRYQLQEQIGEGGFGVVFLAEQEEPVRRKVALKIIKAGMDTKQVIARFEAERQALALMDHPNIAKVLDGGVTGDPRPTSGHPLPSDGRGAGGEGDNSPSTINPHLSTNFGRPYFVMELVRGIPITKFAEENQLTLKERIELFIPVCQAIQHAHQKGVIHRDIKPSNVLVATENPLSSRREEAQISNSETRDPKSELGQSLLTSAATGRAGPPGQPLTRGAPGGHALPQPKVIDFGVAKAIDQRLTEKTLFTNFAQMIGTPAYMSPEQAEMSKQDVDTRTDVYSLGILLYELLTGTTPFPEERLKEVGYAELQRIITQEEPEKPSTALARKRRGEPKSEPQPDDEVGLDRRASRSGSARPAVAPYLQRLRKHRHSSTLASRPSTIPSDLDWIVLKAIDKDRNRRYATPLELAADLQHHLANEPVAAVAPSSVYRFKKFVRRNRTVVIAGMAVAFVAILGVVGIAWQAIRATKAQANAEAALRFVREDLLAQADPFISDPGRPPSRNLKLLTAIKIAAQGIEERYQDQPLVEADIRLTIGKAFLRLNEAELAGPHLHASFDIFSRELGNDDAHTQEAALTVARLLIDQYEYDAAAELSREILYFREREFGPNHNLTLQAMNCLASAYGRGTKDHEAIKLFQAVVIRARALDAPNPLTVLSALSGLSSAHYELGNFDQWRQLNHEIYQTAREWLGLNHPTTLQAGVRLLNHLSVPDAEQLVQEIEPHCLRVLGEEHPTSTYLLSEKAKLAAIKGLPAISLKRKVFELSQRVLGPNDLGTLFEQLRLGLRLGEQGYFPEGQSILTDAMDRIHRVEGAETLMGRRSMRWLAGIHLLQENFAEAEDLRFRVADICRRTLGLEARWTQWQICQLANIYARQGKWQPAAKLYQEALPHYARTNVNRYVAGWTASWLVGDHNSAKEIARLTTERFVNISRPDFAMAISRTLLLTSLQDEYANEFSRLTNVVLNSPLGSSSKSLLAGLTAYRHGLFDEAEQQLAPLTFNLNGRQASLAGFFSAMSQHRQGKKDLAVKSLAQVNDRLERILRMSDLGNTSPYPAEEWVPFAQALIARNEAEMLIQGRLVSAPIDAAFLTQARAKWKPVREMLIEAEWLARSRQWTQAKEGFLQAMQHEYFDWDSATFQDGQLGAKLATLFVLSGDTTGYTQLCQRLLRSEGQHPSGNPKAVLLIPDALSDKQLQTAMLLARQGLATLKPNAKYKQNRPWYELTLGMAAYRRVEYPEALITLTQAQESSNLNCSGAAYAFGALAAWKSGQTTLAQEHLLQAENAFQQLLDGTQDDLGRAWSDAAIFEIALNEARQLLTENTNPEPNQLNQEKK